MSHAITLSDALVQEAQQYADREQRSVADQIEIWAGLGKAVSGLLHKYPSTDHGVTADTIQERLDFAISPIGQRKAIEHLRALPYPKFEAAPEHPDLVVRVDANGTRTLGKFVDREFQTVATL